MKRTPLYQKHIELGATLYTTTMGYAMPASYADVAKEARAVRKSAGMIDLSLMGRLDIKGPDALPLVQHLIVNNAGRLVNGQALYSTMCNRQGLIVDDVVVMRFGDEHLRVITSSMFRHKTLAWIQQHIDARKARAWVTDISSGLAMIGVQGPRSRDVLRGITDVDLAALKFFHFARGKFGNISCLIARLGFSGELGYECYVWAEDAHAAWDLIAEAGRPHGIVPYGMDALDALRWEKGFIFFGFDVTGEHNPYEGRVAAFIDFDCGDFLGREALLEIRDRGPDRRLLGLEVEGAQTAAANAALRIGGREVGHVVAGFQSPNLGRNLAYAWLDRPHDQPGTRVAVEAEGGELQAVVVEMPFLDPEGRRMRA